MYTLKKKGSLSASMVPWREKKNHSKHSWTFLVGKRVNWIIQMSFTLRKKGRPGVSSINIAIMLY